MKPPKGILQLRAELALCKEYLQYRQCDRDNNLQRHFVNSCIMSIDFALINQDYDCYEMLAEKSKTIISQVKASCLSIASTSNGKDLNYR